MRKEDFDKLLSRKVALETFRVAYTHLASIARAVGSDPAKVLYDEGVKRGKEVSEFFELSGELSDKLKYLWRVLLGYEPEIRSEGEKIVVVDVKCPICEGVQADFAYCSFLSGFISGVLGVEVKEVRCKARGDDACVFEVS